MGELWEALRELWEGPEELWKSSANLPGLVRLFRSYFTKPQVFQGLIEANLEGILRRFQFVASFNLDASAPEDSATNSRPIVLMEFLGALPRASLLADWQSDINETNAAQILYRPGFDPHTRVLLRQANVPEPEQPSQTSNLPKVEFVDANATRVELKIPPTDFGTVLLLNDRHDPNWTVTLDGQQAPLLRANNHARAMWCNQFPTICTQAEPLVLPTVAQATQCDLQIPVTELFG